MSNLFLQIITLKQNKNLRKGDFHLLWQENNIRTHWNDIKIWYLQQFPNVGPISLSPV